MTENESSGAAPPMETCSVCDHPWNRHHPYVMQVSPELRVVGCIRCAEEFLATSPEGKPWEFVPCFTRWVPQP